MVDARGLSCPIPVVMVKNEVEKNNPSELTVTVDAMVCVENITRFANANNYKVEVDEKDGDFVMTLKK